MTFCLDEPSVVQYGGRTFDSIPEFLFFGEHFGRGLSLPKFPIASNDGCLGEKILLTNPFGERVGSRNINEHDDSESKAVPFAGSKE